MHKALVGIQDKALMDIEVKYIKNIHHVMAIRPTWMSFEPPPDLRIWAPILKELNCDKKAIGALVEVIKDPQYGGCGYYEGCRVIAHITKDTASSSWTSGPSQWLFTACHESFNAIQNLKDWDCRYNGKQQWSSTSWNSCGNHSGSSGSGAASDWSDDKPRTFR